MVLENAREMWVEIPKGSKGQNKLKAIPKERVIPKMFLRGDSVILVLRNPLGAVSNLNNEENKTKNEDSENVDETAKELKMNTD